MNDVFLDTVGMIAVWDDTDQWHAHAKNAYDLLFKGRKLITTSLVLYECHL
jgi:predicted nucleic acid-binding protein